MAVKQCKKCKMSFANQLQECPYCGTSARSRTRKSALSAPNWAKSDSKNDISADLNTPWKPATYEKVDYRRTFLLLLLLIVSAMAYMMYSLVNEDKGSEYARMEWCTSQCKSDLNQKMVTAPKVDAPLYMGECRAKCLQDHGGH